MSNYRVLKPVPHIDKLDAGDRCTLKLPAGGTVEGIMLTRAIRIDESLLRIVWFNDGRSYPVSLVESWTDFCQFVGGWHDTDNDTRKDQS
ncbi:hypothetical protein [Bifidobacterium castoris]|uniref:Uncharacterized protein n=1 Tax=Bifidobacterium castoris TaxID=2306972 RepID=A0A430F4F2_9BIFI|nr:hypothetical protein [Bifidobacterium castoris]RSX44669.1 hypothetical protein D2E22_1955 [Bifidobacterium castoris]